MSRYPAAYDQYSGGDTIGDLIRQRGDIYAQNALQSGQIWGQGIQNIAGSLGQGFQAWEQGKAEEKKQKALTVQAQAVNDALDRGDMKALFKILPPDKAASVAKAFDAMHPDAMKTYGDRMAIIRDTAKGVESLPEGSREKGWGEAIQALTQNGVIPPDQAQQYATYTPEQSKFFAHYGEKQTEQKTPAQIEAEAAAQARGAASAAKTPEQIQAEAEARARGERLGAPPIAKEVKSPWGQPFTGPDGSSYQRNETTGEIRPTPGVGKKPEEVKPSSQAESKAKGFYERAKEASENFDAVEANASPTTALLPTLMQGTATQVAEQAKDEFIDAYLRPESGAQISKDERSNARKQFFPVTGDSDAVKAQKKKARETVIQGLKGQTGSRTAPAAPSGPSVGTVEGGYRFKGGDPSSPASWEKVK